MATFKRADQEQLEKAQDLMGPEPSELGFVKSLFFGRIRADRVLPYPKQDAEDARRMNDLLAQLDTFLKTEVDADKIDAEERIPQHVIDGLGRMGVLGMTVPAQYGGGGFSHTAYCRVLERIGRHCGGTAVMVGAHQSIGLKALLLAGTEEQKQKYLPPLARGEQLAAFCLTEPEAGSDAANVQTTARLSDDGRTWIINGEKKFATNAGTAGFMTVMAKTKVTENGRTKDKITAFIVTPDLPGFQVVSPNRSKCGIRGCWQGTLKFTDMPVTSDRILGQLGKGLKVALSCLDFGRCTLSAGCLGGAKAVLESSIEHARSRRQFDRPIAEFHLIKQKIGRMSEIVFAMDALTYMCAGLVDRHVEDVMLETAICKLFCSENAFLVADDAMQVWAGEGYMRSSGIERMWRDARINRIVEGASEVMVAFVSLVGMKGVGEDLERTLKMIKKPVGNFGRLARFARGQWSDIVIGHNLPGLPPQLQAEGNTLAGLTKSLARKTISLLRRHRESILDLQLIHQRIAWSVIELFAMAAVLSKLQSQLEGQGAAGNGNGRLDAALQRDLTIGKAYCRHATERIRTHLHTLFTNADDALLGSADAALGLG